MLKDIIEVRPLEGYRLFLKFENGVEGEVDVAELVRFEGVFAPLRDIVKFREVRVNTELGTIRWSDDVDLYPDVLYAQVAHEPIPDFGVKAAASR